MTRRTVFESSRETWGGELGAMTGSAMGVGLADVEVVGAVSLVI